MKPGVGKYVGKSSFKPKMHTKPLNYDVNAGRPAKEELKGRYEINTKKAAAKKTTNLKK